jgi:adenine deaminase
MTASPDTLRRRIAQGAGREPADLVLGNVRLFNLVTGEIVETDIAITGDCITGTYGRYEGQRRIECDGRFAVPGFVDTHFHVESSLLTPLEYDRCVLPHGVTTAIWDPHEIANVLGAEGLRYALECASATVMDIRVMLSSCVPASPLETSGAELAVQDLLPFRDHPKALGLAEFMNFPGVVHADEGCLAKLAAFSDGHVDGHAPLLTGLALNAYLSAGIRTDHETTSAKEAMEKLRKGMHVLIREGSVSKDLHALAGIISAETAPFLAFCTDDRNPLDVAEEGHLDFMIRTAIEMGAPVLHTYRVASLYGARTFGLRDRGLLAPGYRADVVLLDDLDRCTVSSVVAGGHLVDEALFAARETVSPVGLTSVRAIRVDAAAFTPKAFGERTPVIGVIPGKIITEHLSLVLPMVDGRPTLDLSQDVLKLAVVERHGKNGNIATGFVKGFGLTQGAIASSVGHDSHNICVLGASDADMALAVNRLIDLQGGFVVANKGEVVAELPLTVAGLMSADRYEDVLAKLPALRDAARSLGCRLPEPFLQVAFLALPVIPHLKISDRGLVDVDAFSFV